MKQNRVQVSWLLLMLFVAASLFNAVHPLLEHDHSQVQDCEIADKSSCHLKVVHNDLENGCDHQDHLSSNDENCSICYLIQSQQNKITNAFVDLNQTLLAKVYLSPKHQHVKRLVSLSYKKRGPPFMFL